MIVNQRQLADVFGVSIETLVRWQKEGMPCKVKRGPGKRGNEYETSDVFRWRLSRAEANARPEQDGLDDAKTRLAIAQADRYEIENAEKRGELLRAQDVLDEYTQRVVESRAVLLSGPTRLAPLVIAAPGVREAREILESWVDESLLRLSTGARPVRSDLGVVRASAASDALAVGGQRATPLS